MSTGRFDSTIRTRSPTLMSPLRAAPALITASPEAVGGPPDSNWVGSPMRSAGTVQVSATLGAPPLATLVPWELTSAAGRSTPGATRSTPDTRRIVARSPKGTPAS
ncbi:hypothetical protein LVQ62_03065 [Allobranchiibius sp. GilTou73]|nr:hypothetical protein [Allobranchiibius sp. GilTou73]UIJ35385.1 hypothetical protein LVQ62_03065 [Allobranchiibius sp. GilTou73]